MTVSEANVLIRDSQRDTVSIRDGIIIGSNDVLDLKGKIVEITADPAITINGSHWTILPGKIRAMTGVLFRCHSSSSGLMLNVWATGLLRSKELFVCTELDSCYDTNIIGGEWTKPQSMLTPIVRVEVDGPYYNSNRWCGLRMQTNGRPGAPVMKFVCRHNANWLYGNTIEHINFEIPNAGAIHLESCFSTVLNQINIFDANLFGNITDDIIKIGKYETGLRSKCTSIRGYMRLSGVLEGNNVDIHSTNSMHYSPNLSISMVDGIQGADLRVRLPEWIDKRTIQARFVN